MAKLCTPHPPQGHRVDCDHPTGPARQRRSQGLITAWRETLPAQRCQCDCRLFLVIICPRRSEKSESIDVRNSAEDREATSAGRDDWTAPLERCCRWSAPPSGQWAGELARCHHAGAAAAVSIRSRLERAVFHIGAKFGVEGCGRSGAVPPGWTRRPKSPRALSTNRRSWNQLSSGDGSTHQCLGQRASDRSPVEFVGHDSVTEQEIWPRFRGRGVWESAGPPGSAAVEATKGR